MMAKSIYHWGPSGLLLPFERTDDAPDLLSELRVLDPDDRRRLRLDIDVKDLSIQIARPGGG
jgi:hypothetical protein